MSWLHHPSYVPIRDRIISKFAKEEETFWKGKHFIFLCGGRNSERRDYVKQFLEKTRSKDTLCFLAEDAWKIASENKDANALQMETTFAALVDIVIIIVESPGTFAELGAFIVNEELRRKCLVMLNREYEGENSFINTGPVKWFESDKEAKFSPAVQADFRTILQCAGALEDRLGKLKAPRINRKANPGETNKSHVFALCDLVATIGPVSMEHLEFYFQNLGRAKDMVPALLGLAHALKLLDVIPFGSEKLYYLPLNDSARINYHYGPKKIPLEMERSSVVGFLQTIDEGRRALNRVKEKYAG